MDLRNIAVFDMKQAPTCYHGPNGGSCIDYILSTPCLYDSFSQFEVCKVQPFKDHGFGLRQIARASACTDTSMFEKASLTSDTPKSMCRPRSFEVYNIDGNFKQKLQLGQVDEAYSMPTHEMDGLLHEISKVQGHDIPANGVRRGQIKFQSQRRHPRAIGTHASTMYSRKLFRAINQAKEVLRASPGYRRDQTWAAIPDTLRLLPTDQFSTLNVILSRPASNDDAQQMIDSLTQILEQTVNNDKRQRILKWKQRLRSSDAQQFRWLENRSERKPIAITVVSGQPTANSHARLDAISQVWKNIYTAFTKGRTVSSQKYGEHMQRSLSSLPPINAHQVITKLKKIRPSSPDMDHIAPLDLKRFSEVQAKTVGTTIILWLYPLVGFGSMLLEDGWIRKSHLSTD